MKVYKTINKGATYPRTEAVGDIETVKRTRIMPCGSGDDHCVTSEEMKLIEQHTEGDLTLPSGKLGRRLLKDTGK